MLRILFAVWLHWNLVSLFSFFKTFEMFASKYKIIGSELAKENLLIAPNRPPKYTIDDWYFNNQYKKKISETQQELANRVLL